MSAIGLGIAGAGLLLNGYESLHQNSLANKIKPTDPTYEIPPEFAQNREIARQMAEQGLPGPVRNNSLNDINQTQATALAAAGNSANPSGAIAGITGQTNAAKANLDAKDAEARENNQRFFITENTQLGDQELQKQQEDVYDKFTRDFNQYQALKGASMQNMNNAIGGAQQLGMTVLKYHQPGTTPESPDAITTTGPQDSAYLPPGYQFNPYGKNYYIPGVGQQLPPIGGPG